MFVHQRAVVSWLRVVALPLFHWFSPCPQRSRTVGLRRQREEQAIGDDAEPAGQQAIPIATASPLPPKRLRRDAKGAERQLYDHHSISTARGAVDVDMEHMLAADADGDPAAASFARPALHMPSTLSSSLSSPRLFSPDDIHDACERSRNVASLQRSNPSDAH